MIISGKLNTPQSEIEKLRLELKVNNLELVNISNDSVISLGVVGDLSLFEEDKEAVYFSSNEELLEKCLYYLKNEDIRKKIAEAGRERCVSFGYSNENMVKRVLFQVMNLSK